MHRETQDAKNTIERYQARVKNPKSAIRSMCVTCSNGQLSEVRECTVKVCPLWPFRLGENPFHGTTKKRLEREAEEAEEEDDE